jgi:nitrogen fixation/metabolism regulation signal transduction histidine kinase
MGIRVINYIATSANLMIALFSLLLLSLILMANIADNLDFFGAYYTWLLVFNIGGVIFITLIVIANILKLNRSIKRQAIGHKLLGKMIAIFSFLSLIPVVIVFYFSINYLNNSIDNWFDEKVEQGLESALQISQQVLYSIQKDKLNTTKNVQSILENIDDASSVARMEELRKNINAYELTYLNDKNSIIGVAFAQTIKVVPQMPDIKIITSVSDGSPYLGWVMINDEFYVQVVLSVPKSNKQKHNMVSAIYAMDSMISEQTSRVQVGFSQYKQLVVLQQPLKIGYIINLSLSLLLIVLMAVWAVFYFSYRLLSPINKLVMAFEKISGGDYNIILKQTGDDEIGLLVHSFNQMAKRVRISNRELSISQQQTQLQKVYLTTIIRTLWDAVLVFDENNRLKMFNFSAQRILQTKLKKFINKDIYTINASATVLSSILKPIIEFAKQNTSFMQKETPIKTLKRELLIKYNKIELNDGTKNIIVIFDDITDFKEKSKIATWQDIAKKMAHEIKNPLTPIQLSAQRLRLKYLTDEKDKNMYLLDEATNTIIKQVQAMIKMVNAFNEFAAPPKLDLQNTNINNVINEVSALYPQDKILIHKKQEKNLKFIKADEDKIRQLLHNMIKNAIEAQQEEHKKQMQITTSNDGFNVVLELSNPGVINKEIIDNIFEPYQTNKPGGSGIGLAVVKKIVSEHGGTIRVQSDKKTIFTILLPTTIL